MHHMSVLALLAVAACSPKPATQVPADDAPAADAGVDAGDPANPGDAPPPSGSMTAAECEAQGGKVVGDIGDGAIHRPDYVCPESGAAPLGSISAAPEGPVAIEGSVCCP